MILRELFQVAEINYVARAPTNTEVEHLGHKQIMKCLRDKSTTELFKDQNKWAQDGKKKRSRRGGRKSKTSKDTEAPAEAPAAEPLAAAEEPAAPAEAPAEEPAVEPEAVKAAAPAEAQALLKHLNALKGSKNVRLLSGEKLSDELPITKLQEKLQKKGNNGVTVLVMDGIITQRLVDLAPEAGISTVVAEKKGPLPRKPVGLSLYTRSDLS